MEHKQLLTVFNSLPVGIGFFTADGTLVRCNEKASAEFLALTRKRFLVINST